MSQPADVRRRFKHGPVLPALPAKGSLHDDALGGMSMGLSVFVIVYFAGQFLRPLS